MKFLIGNTDLSQIECRVLNTLAGQWDVVEKFRNRVDIYSELASQFYGCLVDKNKPAERGMGKQLELSCGYGAGADTIVRTARAGTYGPPVHLSPEQGLTARDLYRATHPAVVNLWKTADSILQFLHTSGTFTTMTAINWTPYLKVRDHRIFGPGGLWIDYSSLEWHQDESGDAYWRHRVREGWRKTYGARLIQNVVELLARQVISQAMVRVHDMGYSIPLTVHDNIYTLIPLNGVSPEKQLEDICKAVAAPVPWLDKCPIAAEAELLEGLAGKPLYKFVWP